MKFTPRTSTADRRSRVRRRLDPQEHRNGAPSTGFVFLLACRLRTQLLRGGASQPGLR